ncbi:PREDICTED: granulocyte colony-stimulating factor isoform X1 [Hipposideros armiger]|uniref:Granulocyte colony-stimulating factor n=1 Tax=Hipposideros armiger TaxID=186990 RepID=A0A8B7R2P9_HIPAR|nr:PREDICTED: granulocyte colony-stimulating factor isoform X1 [Hipposideros armiger]
MEERRLGEAEQWEAGKPLGEGNLLGTVLGGAGWLGWTDVEAGMGLRSLAGHGGRGRPRRDGEEPPGPFEYPALSILPCPQCDIHKLCHPEELVLLGHSLGIPQAPLSSCSSQALQLTGCLRQLHSGLSLYQGLLQALAGISPELAPTLDTLQLDITDLATNIWQQMEDLGVAPAVRATQGTMPVFTSAFQRRAAGVLVASNLQSSLELAYRVLRYLAEH